MKLLDIINESNEDKEKLIKRVKTIHKSLKKGVVNVNGIRYRYELPEEYTLNVVNQLQIQVTCINFTFYNKDIMRDEGGGDGLPLKIWRIEEGKDVYLNKILTGQDVGDIIYNDDYRISTKAGVEYVNVKNKVRNKYRIFNINAIMTTPSDTSTINESNEDKDTHLEREKKRKKINMIYNTFKHGKIKVDNYGQRPDAIFEYRLSDEKGIFFIGDRIIVKPENIKLIEKNKVASETSTNGVISNLKKKFLQFDIELEVVIYTYNIENWQESPNIS